MRWRGRWWPRKHASGGVCIKRSETQLRQREAEQAVRTSRAGRRAAEAGWPEVREVAEELRQMRQDNHFAESFRRLLQEDR